MTRTYLLPETFFHVSIYSSSLLKLALDRVTAQSQSPYATDLDSRSEENRSFANRYCLQTIDVLSDPANHIAIKAELRLATNFYESSPEEHCPRTELPEPDRNRVAAMYRDWDDTVTPFPFIATCLQIGVGYNPLNGFEERVRKEPLGTFFRDNSVICGIAVVDISDLNNIGYSITDLSPQAVRNFLGPQASPPLIEHRKPSSAMELVDRLARTHIDINDADLQRLQSFPLIPASALDCEFGPASIFFCMHWFPADGSPLTQRARSYLACHHFSSPNCSNSY
jgi:hypothetical protein